MKLATDVAADTVTTAFTPTLRCNLSQRALSWIQDVVCVSVVPKRVEAATLVSTGRLSPAFYSQERRPTKRKRAPIQQISWINSGIFLVTCLSYQTMIEEKTSCYGLAPRAPENDAMLRDALKRCSPSTLEAALAFRRSGDIAHVPLVVGGVIERFIERELRPKLKFPSAAELRLIEDLNVDSLTMLEAVLLLEEVLQITIDNEELQSLRTVGDVQRFTERKLRCLVETAPISPPNLSRSLEQRVSGDHPKRLCERTDLTQNTKSITAE